MGKRDLHVKYARAFENDSFGLSLYHPHPANDLRPGACGYFNGLGKWHTLFYLDQLPADPPLTALGQRVEEEEPIPKEWAYKKSSSMQRVTVNARGEANAQIGPANVGAGFNYTYKNTTSTGAILLTEHPVCRSLSGTEHTYEEWCRLNAKALVSKWPDLKKYGFSVITSTYSTSKWALFASTNNNEEVSFALNAKVEGVAQAGASVLWQETRQLGGWQFSPENEVPQTMWQTLQQWWNGPEPEKQCVVIVDGLWYKYSTWGAIVTKKPLKRKETRPPTFGPGDNPNAAFVEYRLNEQQDNFLNTMENQLEEMGEAQDPDDEK